MKTIMGKLLILALLLPATHGMAAVGDELGCISGNCQNGVGTLVEKKDEGLTRYQGNFVDGKYQGFGKLEFLKDKITYKGIFKAGKRHGRGTQWDKENNVYMGLWKNDKRNGLGIQAYKVEGWRDGSFGEQWLSEHTENYKGTFLNNSFDGEGTYRWPDGVSYTGGWAASKKHGRGYFLYPTGLRSDRLFEFDKQIYDEPLPH